MYFLLRLGFVMVIASQLEFIQIQADDEGPYMYFNQKICKNIDFCKNKSDDLHIWTISNKHNPDTPLEEGVCDNYENVGNKSFETNTHYYYKYKVINDLPDDNCTYRMSWNNCTISAFSLIYNASPCNCSFLKNFTVEAIFHRHKELGQLHLNVSWDDEDVLDERNGTILVSVTHLNSTDDSTHRLLTNLKEHFAILPELTTNQYIELKNGHSYKITITSASGKSKTCSIPKDYTIPECVGEKCDCTKHSPRVNIDTMEFTPYNDSFLLTWQPEKTTLYGKSYNITDVDLIMVKGKSHSRDYEATDEKDDLEQGLTIFRVPKIPRGERYIVRLALKNNFDCINETADYEFYVPKDNNMVLLFVLLVVVFVILLVYKRKIIVKCVKKMGLILPRRLSEMVSQPQLVNANGITIPMSKNYTYIPMEIREGLFDEFEFPRNNLKLSEFIAEGAYGKVYSAKANKIGGIEGYQMVAVKTSGDNCSSEVIEDFKAEIEIFKKIGEHPNIVRLLGCCTIEPPYMLIMELVPCGNLKDYLVDLRKQWLKQKHINRTRIFFPEDSDCAYIQLENAEAEAASRPVSIITNRLPSITETDSTDLESPVTPRTPIAPLTSRLSSFFGGDNSLLLSHSPKTPLLKQFIDSLERILDTTELQNFALQIAQGMAHLEKICITHRDLAARNILINQHKQLKISDFGLSRKGPYHNQRRGKLPLRWMALEAIFEQKYDSRSDVWSFGVVLWEIGNLGAFPYEEIPDTLLGHMLKMGRRLPRPETCTVELYSVMSNCWLEEPEKRPTFHQLVETLDVSKRKVYVDFDQLSAAYVFPPSEEKKDDVHEEESCDNDDVHEEESCDNDDADKESKTTDKQ